MSLFRLLEEVDTVRVLTLDESLGESFDLQRLACVSKQCTNLARCSARSASCELFMALFRSHQYEENRMISAQVNEYVKNGNMVPLLKAIATEIEYRHKNHMQQDCIIDKETDTKKKVDARLLAIALVAACPADSKGSSIFRRLVTTRRGRHEPSCILVHYDECMASAWLTAAQKISRKKDQWQRVFDRISGGEMSSPTHRLHRRCFALCTCIDHLANLWRSQPLHLSHDTSSESLVHARRIETLALGAIYEAFRLVACKSALISAARRRRTQEARASEPRESADTDPAVSTMTPTTTSIQEESDEDDDDLPLIHFVDENIQEEDEHPPDQPPAEPPADALTAFGVLIDSNFLSAVVELVVERHKVGERGAGLTNDFVVELTNRDLPAAWLLHSIARDLRAFLEPQLISTTDRDYYRHILRRWRTAIKRGLCRRDIPQHWPHLTRQNFEFINLYVDIFGSNMSETLFSKTPEISEAASAYAERVKRYCQQARLDSSFRSRRELLLSAAVCYFQMLPRKFRTKVDRIFFPIYTGILLILEYCVRHHGASQFLNWLQNDPAHREVLLRDFVRRLFAIPNLINFRRLHMIQHRLTLGANDDPLAEVAVNTAAIASNEES